MVLPRIQNRNFLLGCARWSRIFAGNRVITTSFVESAVNQVVSKRFVKAQQMRWSQRGAHLLLQVRTQVLNKELRGRFQQWYSGMADEAESELRAAAYPRSCPLSYLRGSGKEDQRRGHNSPASLVIASYLVNLNFA